MSDWRGWIARKLLGFVNWIDPDCKVMCDARARWIFRRDWEQPTMGGKESR